MEQIRKIAGDQIEGMTPTVVVPAMLSFHYGGNWITQQVQLIGIDEAYAGQRERLQHVLAASGAIGGRAGAVFSSSPKAASTSATTKAATNRRSGRK